MLQLIYVSSATRGADDAVVQDILRASRRNNAADRISGLLLYDGRRFLQALEGDRALVEGAYARIRRDGRHRAVVTLSEKEIDLRQFGAWAMAAQSVTGATSIVQAVDALVADVPDLNTRELFRSFARIERKAA